MSVRIVPSITEPVRAKHLGQRRSPWSPLELQVLRERYAAEGALGCMALLPDRNQQSIHERARKMGLSTQQRHRSPLHSNPHLDAAIRKLYSRTDHSRGAVRDFCAARGLTRQWVSERAKALGVLPLRTKEPPWSEAEEDLLEQNSHKCLKSIAKILKRHGYHRTPTAIGIRRARIGLGARQSRIDAGIYSANDIGATMGVDVHVVLRWISHHGLRVRATLPASDGRPIRHEIHRPDLRAWMISHIGQWDHRKCERLWLVDILTNGAAQISMSGMEAA